MGWKVTGQFEIVYFHIENAGRVQVTRGPYTALEPVEGSPTHESGYSSGYSSSEQGEQGEREGRLFEGGEEEVQSQPDVPVDVPVERAEQLARAHGEHAEGDDDAAPVDVDFF